MTDDRCMPPTTDAADVRQWHSDVDRSAELAETSASLLLSSGASLAIESSHCAHQPQPEADNTQSQSSDIASFLSGCANGRTESGLDDDALNWSEVRYSTVAGGNFLVRGASTSSGESLPRKESNDEESCEQTSSDTCRTCLPLRRHLFKPNPLFLYQENRTVEIFVGHPSVSVMTTTDGVIFGDILRRLAGFAKEVSAPILLMESPASNPSSPYGDETTAQPTPRTPYGLGVRMSIAVPGNDINIRHKFRSKVAGLAEEFGLEAWTADRRRSKGKGLWFKLANVRSNYDNLRHSRSDTLKPPKYQVPFTAVGPARLGTSLWFLNQLIDNLKCVVMSTSMFTISNYAVIHFKLAGSETDTDGSGRPSLARYTPEYDWEKFESPIDWDEAFKGLANSGAVGVSNGLGTSTQTTRLRITNDYTVKVGPRFTADSENSDNRIVLWGSWEVEDLSPAEVYPDGYIYMVRQLGKAFARLDLNVCRPEIIYLHGSRLSGGQVRARFKLTVDKTEFLGKPDEADRADVADKDTSSANSVDQRNRRASEKCHDIEEAWTELISQRRDIRARVDIAWQEVRVGRWSSLG